MPIAIQGHSSQFVSNSYVEKKSEVHRFFYCYIFRNGSIPRPIRNPSLIHLFNNKQLQQLKELTTQSYYQAVLFFIQSVKMPSSSRFVSLILDHALDSLPLEQKVSFCVEMASHCLDQQLLILAQGAILAGLKYPCSFHSFGFFLYANGIVFLEENQLDLGIENLRQAYLLLTDHALDPFLLCKIGYAWAKALFLQNRFDEAKVVLLYLKHYTLDLEDPIQSVVATRLRYLMATCLDFETKFDKIFQLLQGGVSGITFLSDNEQIDYFLLLGDSALECKNNQEAITYFQCALKVNPALRKQKRQTEWRLGRAYLESKEYRLALGVFRELVKSHPSAYIDNLIDMAMEKSLTDCLYD